MKLTSLHIQGFGQFDNQTFYLTEGSQLIFGGNESGKSTIYQFIRAMLFGFPNKREMTRDFEPLSGASYGGRLELDHPTYGHVTIERFKNKAKGQANVTLEDGQTGQESLLKKIISPLTSKLFDQVFSFQHEQLTDLTQMDEVRLQHLLLSVGLTGSGQLNNLTDVFLKERQQIFKPTGRLPELNRQLKEFKLLEQKITAIENQEQSYRTKLAEQDALTENLVNLRQRLAEEVTQEQRFIEQQKRFALYVEYTSLEQEVGATRPSEPQTVIAVQDNLQEYRFLEAKEKELLEQQATQQENVSPAFMFYLDNQTLFNQLLANQMTVESLSERQEMLTQQVVDESHQLEQLCATHDMVQGVTTEKLDQGVIKEIEGVAEREEVLIREKIILTNEKSRLMIRKKELDQQLTSMEEAMEQSQPQNQVASRRGFSTNQMLSVVLGAIGVIFLLLMILLPNLLLIVPAVLLVGGGVFLWIKSATEPAQQAVSSFNPMVTKDYYQKQLAEADELAYELNKMDDKLETTANQLSVIEDQKLIWHKLYGFHLKETLTSWLTKIPVVVQLQELQRKIAQSKEQLAECESKLQTFQEDLAFTKQWIGLETDKVREQYQAVQQFVSDQQALAQTERVAYAKTESFQQTIDTLRQDQSTLLNKLIELTADQKMTKLDDVISWLSQQTNLQSNQRELADLRLRLEDYFDLTQTYDLASINDGLIQVSLAKDATEQEITKTQDALQAVRFDIKEMEKNGTLDELYQQQANQLSVIRQLSDDWLVYRMAEEIIQELFQFLSDQQLPSLLTAVSNYFNLLTEERYTQVLIKDSQLVVKDAQRQTLATTQLSTGTRDQLYISFRLAFIQMHQSDYHSPIIIDDGWLHFDWKRKETLFKLIQFLGKESQVICLSSDKDMKEYFDQTKQAVIAL